MSPPSTQPTIIVLYATRHGQARKIAARLGARLRDERPDASVVVSEVRELASDFDLGACAAAILVGSVHMGRHERELVTFVRRHRAQLARLPTAFVSVSLAEATAESTERPAAVRAEAAEHVRKAVNELVTRTGWRPGLVHPVAGALRYRQYNFILRLVMRAIARRTGADTDTSRDHEYTDWPELDRFAGEVARSLSGGQP